MRIPSAFALMVALSIGVAIAAPASALAAHGVDSAHSHVAAMDRLAKATALAPVSPVIRAVPAKHADGLSRDAEDCKTR